MDSKRLNLTNEPYLFVDWALAECVKRSASDQLESRYHSVQARIFPGHFSQQWAFRQLSKNKKMYLNPIQGRGGAL